MLFRTEAASAWQQLRESSLIRGVALSFDSRVPNVWRVISGGLDGDYGFAGVVSDSGLAKV